MQTERNWLDRYKIFGSIANVWFDYLDGYIAKKCVHIQLNISPLECTERLFRSLTTNGRPIRADFNRDKPGFDSVCSICYVIFFAKYIEWGTGNNLHLAANPFVNLHRYHWNYSNLWQWPCILFFHNISDDPFKREANVILISHALTFIITNLNRIKPHHWQKLILKKGLLDSFIKLACLNMNSVEDNQFITLTAAALTRLLTFVNGAKLSKKKYEKIT